MPTQQETSAGGSKRLAPGYVAGWVVAAAHHRVREAWIARQPILLLSAAASLMHNTSSEYTSIGVHVCGCI